MRQPQQQQQQQNSRLESTPVFVVVVVGGGGMMTHTPAEKNDAKKRLRHHVGNRNVSMNEVEAAGRKTNVAASNEGCSYSKVRALW
jgi:hypothetical protein